MEIQVNNKAIRRIILLERDESGDMVPQTLWALKKSKKKVRKELRPLDRVVRKAGKAQKSFAETLMKRHKVSNKKRKNGGIRDLAKNLARASKKATK